jgi:hypothetical protein
MGRATPWSIRPVAAIRSGIALAGYASGTAEQRRIFSLMRKRLRFLGIAGLALAAAACGPNRNCLRWPRSHLASDLVWREYTRAAQSPRPLRARILESMQPLIPDWSDRIDDPTCEGELIVRLADDLDERPLRYDNALLHEVRALGNIADVYGTVVPKASILVGLASVADAEVTPYQFSAGEVGPAPGPSYVRHLALALLLRSNLYLNDPSMHRYFAERLLASQDDGEQLLLVGAARALFDDVYWAWGNSADESRMRTRIARAWIEDIERRLAGTPSALSLGLVFSRWVELAARAERIGVARAFGALTQRVIDARGAFPLTRGIPGGARDLAVLAVLGADGSAAAGKTLNQWSEDVPFPSLPGFQRTAWALEEPTMIFWQPEVLARRLRDLDREIAHLTDVPNNGSGCCAQTGEGCVASSHPIPLQACTLFGERAALTPTADGDRLVDWLLSFDRCAWPCTLALALGTDAAAPERRGQAALEALGPPGVAALASRAAIDAAFAIGGHPLWVERLAGLRDWLAHEALTEGDTSYRAPAPFWVDETRIWLVWRPILLRMVLEDAVSPVTAARERARAIVARWIALLRPGRGALPSVALEDALLLSVVAAAAHVGLAGDAKDLIARVFRRPDVAMWIFEGDRETRWRFLPEGHTEFPLRVTP